MFGSNKKHIVAEGRQALSVVTDVRYARVLGMTQAKSRGRELQHQAQADDAGPARR